MSKQAIISAVEEATAGRPGGGGAGIENFAKFSKSLVRIGALAPPWWSPYRDAFLREYWKDDGAFLSGIMFNAANKLANIPPRVVARDPSIASHVAQAEELEEIITIASEYGQGLHTTMLKWVEDWLGTDNGGFMEVLGGGPRDGEIKGLPIGVRHVDSLLATRTGDPIYPVRVIESGKRYLLHWTRVIYASQSPSADRDMYGVGYSSVSRSIKIAHDLNSMLNYKAEKMGSRPKSKLLVGKNIGGDEIMQAFAVADLIMNELGLVNFAKLVAIGGSDIEVNDIDLNSFDPFDEKTQTTLGMYALAFAWGLEPAEVLPVVGSASSNEQIALQRSRGKLPQTFVTTLENGMSFKLLPRHLKFALDFPDDSHDHQVAVIEDIHARSTQRMVASGATTKQVERRRMYDRGALTRQMFIEMQLSEGVLEDGSPVGRLFFDEGYSHLLLLPRQYLVTSPEYKTEAMTAVYANRAAVFAAMNTGSVAQKRKSNEALAALQWLENQYTFVQNETPEPEVPLPIGATSRTANEDGGASDKSAGFFQKRLTELSQR